MPARRDFQKKSSVIFLFSVICGVFVLLMLHRTALAGWYVDEYGQLVFEQSGLVLGKGSDSDDDDDDEQSNGGSSSGGSSGPGSSESSGGSSSGSGSGSGSSGGDSSGSGSSNTGSSSPSGPSGTGGSNTSASGSTGLGSTPSTQTSPPTTSPSNSTKTEFIDPVTGVRTRIQTKDGETKTEIKFSEDEKLKIRTKEGETRTDVYQGGTKVRLERREGRLIIKAENEAGENVELGDQELFVIKERLDKDIVKVATAEGDAVVFSRGAVGARTNFPLSVDLATNELIVTTPAGQRAVTVLPDTAVANLLAANVIDRLGPQAIAAAGSQGELANVSSVVQLGEQNGVPVYEIRGISDQSLLGFIPVQIERTVVVSAETGETIDTETSLLDGVLDFISI